MTLYYYHTTVKHPLREAPLKKPKHAPPKEISAITLRHHLGDILDQVANKRQRFLVKRAGIPAAVLLSIPEYEDLEDLIETWREQQDKEFQQSLIDSGKEIAEGKGITLEELRRSLATKARRVKQ